MTVEVSLQEVQEELCRLSREIDQIKERNQRVESNKTWETSWTRLWCITALLYGTMILLFYALASHKPLLDALIPTFGYLISTFTLPFIREKWQQRR